MVNLYVKKIVEKAINPATGEVWKTDDVPARWRDEVEERLKDASAGM